MTTTTVAGTVSVPVYRAERNADGTWNVFDVPVFAETKKRMRDGSWFEFTPDWMRAAVARSQADAAKGYLGTLKIRHIGDPQPPEFAGHFLLTRVGEMDLPRLGRVMVARANYLTVPDVVYQRMAKGLLPGVSIEALDVDERLIDAVALLDKDTPHIPFPLFRVPAAEAVPEGFENCSVDNGCESGAVALFKRGNRVALLSRFPMADDPKPDDKPKPKEGEGGGGDGGSAVDKIVALVMKSPDLEKAIRAKVEEMISTLGDGKGGGSGGDQPHDVKAAKEEAARSAQLAKEASDRVVKLQAEVDALKGAEEVRKTEATIVAEVDATLGRLARFHLGDGARDRMIAMGKAGGVAALKLYEDTVKAHGTEAPVGVDPALFTKPSGPAGGDLPAEVLAYQGKGPAVFEKAVAANRNFESLRSMGRMKPEQRGSFIQIEVEGVGAALAAPVK